ncbi:hypothetical protein SAMN02910292_01234 [Lachnospiraceae bacterium XBB2008]|nr:hypothetical protein SAMN02910292_01234 [Lachnospiraceae bacterium XBB2008]
MNSDTNPIRSKKDMYRLAREEWDDKQKNGTHQTAFAYRYLIGLSNKKSEKLAPEINEERIGLYINKDKEALNKWGRLKQYELIKAICIAHESGIISGESALRCISDILSQNGRKKGTVLKNLEKLISENSDPNVFFSDNDLLDQYLEQLRKELVNDYLRPVRCNDADDDNGDDLYSDPVAFAMGLLADLTKNESHNSWMTDNDYLEKCSAVYETICKKEKTCNLFFPIGFDSRTGSGIYLVGKNHLEKLKLPYDPSMKNKHCIWGVSRFDYADIEADDLGSYFYASTSLFPCSDLKDAIKTINAINFDSYATEMFSYDIPGDVIDVLEDLVGEKLH